MMEKMLAGEGMLAEDDVFSPVTPGLARVAGFSRQTSPFAPSESPTVVSSNDLEARHALSNFQAAVALFKAIVGPGILFLPSGVKNAGVVSSLIVGAVVGSVAAWCMLLVLDCSAILRRRGCTVTSVGDVGEAAFGACGRVAVEVAVVISQLGFCTAYCVFIAGNVQSVLFELHGGMTGVAGDGAACNLSGLLGDKNLVYYVILAVILPLTPVGWVRQLRYFAITNIIASILVVGSTAYMLVLFFLELAQHGVAQELNLFRPSGTLVFIGTAMYAWEGIGVLLPIERTMADPKQLPSVVGVTMLCVCLLQVGFGTAAYLFYGEGTASIVTVSLARGSIPGGRIVVVAIQLAWVIEVILTFPLQLFPAAKILESRVCRERRSGQKWCKNLLRTGLVLLCVAISTLGYSSVDNLVSLIGALGCVPLAIVFPAMFHYKLRYNGGREASQMSDAVPSRPQQHAWIGPWSDICVGFCGVLGVIVSMTLAIYSWATSSFSFPVCIRMS